MKEKWPQWLIYGGSMAAFVSFAWEWWHAAPTPFAVLVWPILFVAQFAWTDRIVARYESLYTLKRSYIP